MYTEDRIKLIGNNKKKKRKIKSKTYNWRLIFNCKICINILYNIYKEFN